MLKLVVNFCKLEKEKKIKTTKKKSGQKNPFETNYYTL